MRRTGSLLAASALALLLAACAEEPPDEIVPLDDEIVETYLEAYATIGPAYREAYDAGASPTAIHSRDDIQQALGKAGWSWQRYQEVHGSVSNALLYYEDPLAYERLELAPSDAPPENVQVVERHYFDIKKARLIALDETYEQGPSPGGSTEEVRP